MPTTAMQRTYPYGNTNRWLNYVYAFSGMVHKCFWLLLLIPCCSFADSENTKSYPDKIMCIINKYEKDITNKEKYYGNFEKNLLWNSIMRVSKIRYKEREPKVNIQIKSIEEFQIGPKEGTTSKNGRFLLEIWMMETPTDANKLFRTLNYFANSSSLVEKPPKRYFIYENFFVLLSVNSVNTRHAAQEGVSEIIETCFGCGTIDVGFTHVYGGDKEGCGKLYRGVDTKDLIFEQKGQND